MSQLPPMLQSKVSEILDRSGDTSGIRAVRALSGGCINHAVRLDTVKNHYFLKWNENPLPKMFQCEAAGLELLAKTNTIRVPKVFGFAESSANQPAFILMEWLDGEPSLDQALLGEQLAELHRISGPTLAIHEYGLDHDN